MLSLRCTISLLPPSRGLEKSARRLVTSQAAERRFRGVTAGGNGKWRASITAGKKVERLGEFDSPTAAANAYDAAARKHHGKTAKLNFPVDAPPPPVPPPSAPEVEDDAAAREHHGKAAKLNFPVDVPPPPVPPPAAPEVEDEDHGSKSAGHMMALRAILGDYWVGRLEALGRPAAQARSGAIITTTHHPPPPYCSDRPPAPCFA